MWQTIIKTLETKLELKAAFLVAQEEPAVPDYQSIPDGGSIAGAAQAAGNMLVGFFSLQSMTAMRGTMSLVPMLCVLIFAARMYSTMSLATSPQSWAKGFFLTTTICVYIQTISVVFFPKSGTGCAYWFGKVVDWIFSALLYMGIVVIIISICVAKSCEHPENKAQLLKCLANNMTHTGIKTLFEGFATQNPIIGSAKPPLPAGFF